MSWQILLSLFAMLVLWGLLWHLHGEFKKGEEIRRIREEDRLIRAELESIEHGGRTAAEYVTARTLSD